MILSVYQILTTLGAPLIHRYLEGRKQKGKEHPTRFSERLGHAGRARPKGRLIWIHGASVGEVQSVFPLAQKMLEADPKLHILLTSGTLTSAQLIDARCPHERLIHQFIPVDRRPYVRRFLDSWQPDLAIWLESDLWPNMVLESHERHIPMVLLNARLSDKSYKNWQRFPATIRKLLNCFQTVYAQSLQDRQRYQHLGAAQVAYIGNLKYAAPDLPFDLDRFEALKQAVGRRPIWMAASTHPGEETQLMQIHQKLEAEIPGLLSIIVPRHPHRGSEIRAENAALGLKIVQRSKNEAITEETQIYLGDTLGEMGLFYRLSPIVFMGKSLKPLGGQNPLEPARLDCAILCGPFMTNFAEIMQEFEKADALQIVKDEAGLTRQLSRYLSDPELCRTQGDKAKALVLSKSQILDQCAERLFSHMEKKG